MRTLLSAALGLIFNFFRNESATRSRYRSESVTLLAAMNFHDRIAVVILTLSVFCEGEGSPVLSPFLPHQGILTVQPAQPVLGPMHRENASAQSILGSGWGSFPFAKNAQGQDDISWFWNADL